MKGVKQAEEGVMFNGMWIAGFYLTATKLR